MSLKVEFCIGTFNSPFAPWRLFFKRYIDRIVSARENREHKGDNFFFEEERKRDILLFYFDVI